MTLTRLARSVHRAGRGTVADLVLYAGSTVYAGIIAVTSNLPAHKAWGTIAVFGYAALTVLSLVQRLTIGRATAHRATTHRPTAPAVRMAVVFVGWVATTLVPLVVESAQRATGMPGRAQDEVGVVEVAAARLVDTGSPYLSHDGILAALPAQGYLAYVPYNPGIAVFGLPRRYGGDVWWADARVWFAVVTAVALVAALVLLRRVAPATVLVRAAQAVTVLPICALTLATGGDDMPVLALTLLALAFAVRGLRDGSGGTVWWLAAGLVVGDAAAMKLFALPVLVILAVVVAVRGGAGRVAWRPLGWYLLPALAIPVVTLGPITLRDPDGVVENLVRYPLGHGLAKSPAASNLPGHLIAVLVPGGGVVASVLLVVAGLAFMVYLLVRPPVDVAAAARRAAVAMLLAIMLAPATRFGYLLYPAAYAVWSVALYARSDETDVTEGAGVRVAAASDLA
ncbi:glycosyltransferase 87 family protein [Actinocatenispora rupis]|uniref:glycosyltransferase 87 family protein n=1 Tax=Actinocatenispora rupis TaxID=519421 RepID=UPI001EF1DCFB|nr:glycosyltransferase 87 family protein [Actinocatenispora rupis]